MDGEAKAGFVMPPKKRPKPVSIPRARDLALLPRTSVVAPSEQVLNKIGSTTLVAGIDIEVVFVQLPCSSPLCLVEEVMSTGGRTSNPPDARLRKQAEWANEGAVRLPYPLRRRRLHPENRADRLGDRRYGQAGDGGVRGVPRPS